MSSDELPEIRSLWDFNDPQTSRTKFNKVIQEYKLSEPNPFYLEVITQIARTYGLEGNFADGHDILNRYQLPMDQSNSQVKTRMHLERGRLFNSAGDTSEALSQFRRAWDLAKTNGLHYLAVDAAHMIAIAEEEPRDQLEWNMIAISYAEESQNPEAKLWLGSLYNNTGWSYHDMGQYNKALDLFQKAYEFHLSRNNENATRIAKWTIGRVYRSMERYDEALEIMHQLEQEATSSGNTPGAYTLEELGELYLTLNKPDKYQVYFKDAYQQLSKDVWLQRNEPKRLERMKKLSED